MTTLLTRLMRSVPYQAETKTAEKRSLLYRLMTSTPYLAAEKTAQTPQQNREPMPTARAGDTTDRTLRYSYGSAPMSQTSLLLPSNHTILPLIRSAESGEAVMSLDPVAGAAVGYRYAPQMANQTIGRVPYLTPSDRAARQIVANPSLSHTYFRGAEENADRTLRTLLENNHIPRRDAVPIVRDALRSQPSESNIFLRTSGGTQGYALQSALDSHVGRPKSTYATEGMRLGYNLNNASVTNNPRLITANHPYLSAGAPPITRFSRASLAKALYNAGVRAAGTAFGYGAGAAPGLIGDAAERANEKRFHGLREKQRAQGSADN